MHCANAIVGGTGGRDLTAGPFYIDLSATPDAAGTSIGAALSYLTQILI